MLMTQSFSKKNFDKPACSLWLGENASCVYICILRVAVVKWMLWQSFSTAHSLR